MQSETPGGCRFAPRRFLSVTPDHYSPVRLLAFSDRNRLVAATFRSLVTTARFRATITRSKFLACCFFATPVRSGNRSADRSPSTGGLHPLVSGSWRPARFPDAKRALSTALRISTPLQGVCSLPDQSVQPVCCRKIHLPDPPDCSSLPAADLRIVPAADHRSELATSPAPLWPCEPILKTCTKSRWVYSPQLYCFQLPAFGREACKPLREVVIPYKKCGFKISSSRTKQGREELWVPVFVIIVSHT
jgi:hypothetical protein